jgi:hypothetical protein
MPLFDQPTATLAGALLGFVGTATGSFLAVFASESYKRFRDAKALGAGLTGELASYREAWPMLQRTLADIENAAGSGNRVHFPRIEKPLDRFYEANVEKLGLLGPDAAEMVAYVYNNINSFRVTMELLGREETTAQQQAILARSAGDAIKRAVNRADALFSELTRLKNATWGGKSVLYALAGVALLVITALLAAIL